MKKTIWLVVTLLLLPFLFSAAFALAASQEKEAGAPGKAHYGGTFVFAHNTEPLLFDEAQGRRHIAQTLNLTNETLMQGDWAKGPAGTGQVTWIYTIFPSPDVHKGCVATHWEMPDDTTQIYHIREGIHFHNKAPANGRELTADDVVFSMKRLWNIETNASHRGNYPWDAHMESITAPDKRTVVIKFKPGKMGIVYEIIAEHLSVVPVEIAEADGTEWGSKFLIDWKNSIGTGPFMMTEFVTGSSVSFVKNPNYWDTDPVGPGKGNKLPYLDGVKWFIIPDAATRYAALRTGKVDWLHTVPWEDAESLIKTNPELKHVEFPSGAADTLNWRVDKPPFTDIRVRRALSMAVNQKEIIDTYHGGHAEILSWPIAPLPEYKDMYTALDQLPESTRELFEYHPEKAKALLAEAGFPNGFKFSVVCNQGQVDLLSILASSFAKVGVELALDVREQGAYNKLLLSKGYEALQSGQVGYLPYKFFYSRTGGVYNFSQISDPRVDEAYKLNAEEYFDWPAKNKRMKELSPYMLSQAWLLQLPAANYWNFWAPWVKNYHGELNVGYNSYWNFHKWIWIDQNLREKTTGKK